MLRTEVRAPFLGNRLKAELQNGGALGGGGWEAVLLGVVTCFGEGWVEMLARELRSFLC